jgi:hypothetical protein
LVENGSFTEGDCFPFKVGDTPRSMSEFRVCSSQWKGGKRPSLDRLRKKCKMAEWERGWTSPGFYPEYQPFNPFFFPSFGYDPNQHQGVNNLGHQEVSTQGDRLLLVGVLGRFSKGRDLETNNNEGKVRFLINLRCLMFSMWLEIRLRIGWAKQRVSRILMAVSLVISWMLYVTIVGLLGTIKLIAKNQGFASFVEKRIM